MLRVRTCQNKTSIQTIFLNKRSKLTKILTIEILFLDTIFVKTLERETLVENILTSYFCSFNNMSFGFCGKTFIFFHIQ